MALVHRLGWDPGFIVRSAWFWPLGPVAARFAAHADWPTRAELDVLSADAAASARIAPVRFGPNVRKADKRAHGRIALDALYDARIALRGEVPTRERDWHDLFNALCFVTFPRAKRALHTRQYRALAARLGSDAHRMPNARSKEQDALTLFDEGGVAIAADARAAYELAACAQPELADRLAALEHAGHARRVPFGHALFEHLVEGLPCPGGGTRVIALEQLPADDRALVDKIDAGLCALLEDPAWFQSPAEHLPLRFNRMSEVAPIRRA